ncbi:MAG: hypothetical protein NZM39_05255 [Bernardetiaceae bacterium]|nr:hypothetical protein [Bernardetiaceae bacterium]
MLTVILLFLVNKFRWIEEKHALESRYDSLLVIVKLNNLPKARESAQYDSLQKLFFRHNQYDPLVTNGFRLYGLFKDVNNVYTLSTIAEQFNISNPNSIKISEVEGKNWYIVPVKGVHFVRLGETAGSIARIYYRNPADSVLIQLFNHKVSPGSVIFIPFDKVSP